MKKVRYLKDHASASPPRKRGSVYFEPDHVADALCAGSDAIGELVGEARPEPKDEVTLDDMTVAELKLELDELGVEYLSRARKAELEKLLATAKS